MKKTRRKKHRIIKFEFLLLLVLCITFGWFCLLKNKSDITDNKQNEYDLCINKSFSEEDINEKITNKISEIDRFIADHNYKVSVYYEDLTIGFNYKYNSDTVYYGCSLIKLVDALYLIDKAIAGEINLDTEFVTYEPKHIMAYSSGMKNHSIGEAISLRDLITYATSLSDNSAHLMLIDYIGFTNLKQYGLDLGAKVILTGGDLFGNQTAEDTNIYLKKAYQIIKGNEEYGTFLKNIMDNNERNAFNTDDIKIYHKYGSYMYNYHDIGLSLDDRPYAISIFTLHEKSNYLEVVQGIHSKIRELHDLFYENREDFCKTQIYDGYGGN